MLRIFKNQDKQATTALIEDCELDAVTKIGKVLAHRNSKRFETCKGAQCMCGSWDKTEAYKAFAMAGVPNTEVAIMSNKITGTVVCDGGDTYKDEVGESEAVKKAMNNHNNAFRKALKRWQIAMIKDVIAVCPESFDEALAEALK